MPVIKLAEAKKLLQIPESNETKDETIEAMIPLIQSFITLQTGNNFAVEEQYCEGELVFNADTNTITATNGDFAFRPAMDILIEGTLFNDGVYSIAVSNTDTLTVNEPLEAETVELARVTRVKYPPELKLTVSKMIEFNLNKKIAQGITSERLGDYSVSYGNTGDYPASILSELQRYNKLSWL